MHRRRRGSRMEAGSKAPSKFQVLAVIRMGSTGGQSLSLRPPMRPAAPGNHPAFRLKSPHSRLLASQRVGHAVFQASRTEHSGARALPFLPAASQATPSTIQRPTFSISHSFWGAGGSGRIGIVSSRRTTGLFRVTNHSPSLNGCAAEQTVLRTRASNVLRCACLRTLSPRHRSSSTGVSCRRSIPIVVPPHITTRLSSDATTARHRSLRSC